MPLDYLYSLETRNIAIVIGDRLLVSQTQQLAYFSCLQGIVILELLLWCLRKHVQIVD